MLTRGITLLKVIKKHTQIEETSLAEISVNLTNNQPQSHQLNKIEILFLEEEIGICLENLDLFLAKDEAKALTLLGRGGADSARPS